jgi:sterol desaturase/sphingolipid hydroxylase (fatty acid hydroxylase superfamily)
MTEKLFSPVDYAVPFFILLVILEMLWVRRNAPEKYEPRDTLTSLALGTGSTVAGALFGGTMFAITTIPWTWWAWIACFVLDDFLLRVSPHGAPGPLVLGEHVNHHSSQHYNLSTALRQTWTGTIAFGFIFRLPLLLIGFPRR